MVTLGPTLGHVRYLPADSGSIPPWSWNTAPPLAGPVGASTEASSVGDHVGMTCDAHESEAVDSDRSMKGRTFMELHSTTNAATRPVQPRSFAVNELYRRARLLTQSPLMCALQDDLLEPSAY